MRSMWKKYGLGSVIVASGMLVSFTLATDVTEAKVTGLCSDCHTMHNSQNGSAVEAMGTTGKITTLQPMLVKGSCIGCHGMGGADKIKTMSGGSKIPQVLHSGGGNLINGGDLAGGNFGYITGAKGSTPKSDTKGHNVIDLGEIDDNLTYPPGHHIALAPGFTKDVFTCAGFYGCHGDRLLIPDKSSFKAIAGAHHTNVDGQCGTADATYNSYRFLWGVKGYENQTDKWQNATATSHNEYYGSTTPLNYSNVDCTVCHDLSFNMRVRPKNNTISGFCAGCHGNFHLINTTGTNFFDMGIGSTTTPFLRHPTDVKLVSGTGVSNEYASYNPNNGNKFSTEAPVARTTVPSGPSDVVTPTADIVTCLSCHGAHATDYPDMLRWDYSGMLAHTTDKNTGCFVCHTAKDNP